MYTFLDFCRAAGMVEPSPQRERRPHGAGGGVGGTGSADGVAAAAGRKFAWSTQQIHELQKQLDGAHTKIRDQASIIGINSF